MLFTGRENVHVCVSAARDAFAHKQVRAHATKHTHTWLVVIGQKTAVEGLPGWMVPNAYPLCDGVVGYETSAR